MFTYVGSFLVRAGKKGRGKVKYLFGVGSGGDEDCVCFCRVIRHRGVWRDLREAYHRFVEVREPLDQVSNSCSLFS